MVGTGFDAVTINEFLSYWTTLLVVPIFLVLATSINFHVFRRVFGFDAFTSMFSALPGGMVEMVTSGRDMDADVKTLTIIHLMRVVIIVIGASILGLYVGVQDLRMQTPSLYHAEFIVMHLALGYLGWKVFAYLRSLAHPYWALCSSWPGYRDLMCCTSSYLHPPDTGPGCDWDRYRPGVLWGINRFDEAGIFCWYLECFHNVPCVVHLYIDRVLMATDIPGFKSCCRLCRAARQNSLS